MHFSSSLLTPLIPILLPLLSIVPSATSSSSDTTTPSTPPAHTSNVALVLSSSRYWFNYRHQANALALYRQLRRLGMADSQIVLMLADDAACDPRNALSGTMYGEPERRMDLYDGCSNSAGVQIDYRGFEVTPEAVLNVLTDRHPAHTPRSKRLITDERTNVLVYLTGHGGDGFLKFQDTHEITSHDLAFAFEQMHLSRRFNRLLFITDTCQANTLYDPIRSPGILATGSSAKGENSYSHLHDRDLGVGVIDKYTHHLLDFLQTHVNDSSTHTMQDLFDMYHYDKFASHAGIRTDLLQHGESPSSFLIRDFFAGTATNVYLDD